MKNFLLILASFALVSCQNSNPTNIQPTSSPIPTTSASAILSPSPTPLVSSSPTLSPTPTPSLSSSISVKYTREDYIRLFKCGIEATLKSREIKSYAALNAHLSFVQNDMLWEIHNKEGSGQLATYNYDVINYALPYGCK